MGRILPLLLLSRKLIFIDRCSDWIFASARPLKTKALSKAVHVSIDHLVGRKVTRVLPVWVGPVGRCLRNHVAFFESVWH